MAEKKAMDSLMETFEEFKNKQNELEKKMAKGEDVSELKSNIEKLQNAMDVMEAKSQIPAFGAVDTKSYSEKEVKEFAAFNDFLRNGERNMTPESEKTIKNMLMEYKDMSGGTPADGGNLVPQILASRIIDKVKEISPIRMHADVLTIGIGNELQTPRKTKAAAGGWIGENAARPKTDSPQFDLLKNPVMEMYANCAITQSLLEDQAFNLESYISNDIATTFAQLEGSAFVTGNGNLKPSGILQGAGAAGVGFGVVKSGTADDFTLDNIIDLEYSLSSQYIANAKWFASRQTIRKMRGFKDTTGQYLWQPSNIVGEPATFDGYPVIETPDMPVTAADAFVIAFGDMRQGYQIVDKRGMTMLRDPYTNKPFVNFYATMRVGGKVANTEAVKLLQCKA